MEYKIGAYSVDAESVKRFISLICKRLNISEPKVYIINTKYTKEFVDSVHKYDKDYIKKCMKDNVIYDYTPPTMNLYYYDEFNNLKEYEDVDNDDVLFLGMYDTKEDVVYINLGAIHQNLAMQCLFAKKRGVELYHYTERKLNIKLKDTIMHECYHSYQSKNNLESDCNKCDQYALKEIKDKDILHYPLIKRYKKNIINRENK